MFSPMRLRAIAAPAALACSLAVVSGCASIMDGDDQTIVVETIPAGASCELTRDGYTIAIIRSTPGEAHVDRSSDDIMVLCELEGHAPGHAVLSSDINLSAGGNLIVGGLPGVGFDLLSGAAFEYDKRVLVVLSPEIQDT